MPTSPSARPVWLLAPIYGHADADGSPHRPTATEALRELADAVNVLRDRARVFPLAFFLFHVTTGVLFVWSLTVMTWKTLMWGFVVHQVVSLGFQTFWYHRYCSHGAFRFSSTWFPRLLLWTNPAVLREETYAIAHRVHHQYPDVAGDPYGPHLGWFGSYLSWESLYRTNRAITERDYETLRRSFRHLAMPTNDYATFVRTGSIERVWHYAARTVTAQALFVAISYAAGGVPFVLAGYGGLFIFTFLLREFAWRGHRAPAPDRKRAGWEFDHRSLSTNSRFYGFFAAEWHDNHHRLPTSANCAVLPGQVDIVFALIRGLHRIGVVSTYHDATAALRAQLTAPQSGTVPGAAAGDEIFLET